MSSSNHLKQYHTGIPAKWSPSFRLHTSRGEEGGTMLYGRLWFSCFLCWVYICLLTLCLSSELWGLPGCVFFSKVAFWCLKTVISPVFPSSHNCSPQWSSQWVLRAKAPSGVVLWPQPRNSAGSLFIRWNPQLPAWLSRPFVIRLQHFSRFLTHLLLPQHAVTTACCITLEYTRFDLCSSLFFPLRGCTYPLPRSFPSPQFPILL